MPVHKLILMPADPHARLDDCSQLAARLQAIGLIEASVAGDSVEFYPAGEHFMQRVSFLGCSPNIELEPPADSTQLATAVVQGSFCHVMLSCTEMMQFRADPQTRPPGCPQCSQPVANWETCIRQWRTNPVATQWSCRACGYHGELTDWSLRKGAGFGKVFVEIRGIYPSEAVPDEALLKLLQSLTGGRWRYIYIKE